MKKETLALIAMAGLGLWFWHKSKKPKSVLPRVNPEAGGPFYAGAVPGTVPGLAPLSHFAPMGSLNLDSPEEYLGSLGAKAVKVQKIRPTKEQKLAAVLQAKQAKCASRGGTWTLPHKCVVTKAQKAAMQASTADQKCSDRGGVYSPSTRMCVVTPSEVLDARAQAIQDKIDFAPCDDLYMPAYGSCVKYPKDPKGLKISSAKGCAQAGGIWTKRGKGRPANCAFVSSTGVSTRPGGSAEGAASLSFDDGCGNACPKGTVCDGMDCCAKLDPDTGFCPF